MISHASRGAPGAAARARPGPAGTAGASAQLRPHYSHSAHSLDLPLTPARLPRAGAQQLQRQKMLQMAHSPSLAPWAASQSAEPHQSSLSPAAFSLVRLTVQILGSWTLLTQGVEQRVKVQGLYWAPSQCSTSVNSVITPEPSS